MTTFLLYESASGYGLFEVQSFDELASVDAVQKAVSDISRFGKVMKLSAFKPFTSAANALEQINAVSESQVSLASMRVHIYKKNILITFRYLNFTTCITLESAKSPNYIDTPMHAF